MGFEIRYIAQTLNHKKTNILRWMKQNSLGELDAVGWGSMMTKGSKQRLLFLSTGEENQVCSSYNDFMGNSVGAVGIPALPEGGYRPLQAPRWGDCGPQTGINV